MLNEILHNFKLSDKEVYNVYPYGSRVYGNHTDASDHDFIIIANRDINEFSLTSDDNKINVHLYSPAAFEDQLVAHKIAALECFFLPTEKMLKNKLKFFFPLNKEKLRSSISEKASHSWVKAKKKMEVEKDKNIYIAKKSLFHSFRIIDFGIQIAGLNTIKDYSITNEMWIEIATNPSENWEDYKKQYQDLFNHRMSEFRKFAPKGIKK